jgi:hypothetical protein
MGQNLAQLFTMLAELSDEEVREAITLTGGCAPVKMLVLGHSLLGLVKP